MKTKLVFIIAVILVAGWLLPAQATVVPVFEPADFITWGSGQTILTDKNGVIPCVGDWNGDNVKDIMVGTYTNGELFYFQNSGTNTNPVFPTRVNLQADGQNIAVSYG